MHVVKLTDHFTLDEFQSRDGVRMPHHLIEDARLLCQWWLEPLRAEFGAVVVRSGWRSPAHNMAVGGARRSVHLGQTPMPRPSGTRDQTAMAADCSPRTGTPVAWVRWAQEHRRKHPHLGQRARGGIGRYSSGGFVHLDTSAMRDWQA